MRCGLLGVESNFFCLPMRRPCNGFLHCFDDVNAEPWYLNVKSVGRRQQQVKKLRPEPRCDSVTASETQRCETSLNLYFCSANSIIIIFLGPTSTKPQAVILKLNNVNGCNNISFGDHSILEGDRIPLLKSHGQALEEELCFPGVLSDNSDTPANLLRHFYGCLMPCTCCLDGKRTEDVGAGQNKK